MMRWELQMVFLGSWRHVHCELLNYLEIIKQVNVLKVSGSAHHILHTTELTKSNLFIYLFTLSVGLKYDVVSRSAECCTQFSRERDQHTAYFPTDDIFLNFGSSRRLAVDSKSDLVWEHKWSLYWNSLFLWQNFNLTWQLLWSVQQI